MNIYRESFRSYSSQELQSAELGRDVRTSLCSEVDYRSEMRIKFFWKLSALTNEKIKSNSWPDFINSNWAARSLQRSVTSARTYSTPYILDGLNYGRHHNQFLTAWTFSLISINTYKFEKFIFPLKFIPVSLKKKPKKAIVTPFKADTCTYMY